MKIRNGFVSNSSSSSFIVISYGNRGQGVSNIENETFIIGKDGEYEFGWEYGIHSDVDSKINFAYLQTLYANKPEWTEMLFDVLKEHFRCEKVETILHTGYDDKEGFKFAYIDHQSAGSEGCNLEMFESEEILKDFLFNEDSYIQTDNDNH